MAKESMKAREVKRAKMCLKYAEKKWQKYAGDYMGLQKLPKNSSPVRAHNRCKITGRPKGYMRHFGISRVKFREMANKGLIPGVEKQVGKLNRYEYRPIADFLTRIRNANSAGLRTVVIPSSKIKKEITKILYDQSLF